VGTGRVGSDRVGIGRVGTGRDTPVRHMVRADLGEGSHMGRAHQKILHRDSPRGLQGAYPQEHQMGYQQQRGFRKGCWYCEQRGRRGAGRMGHRVPAAGVGGCDLRGCRRRKSSSEQEREQEQEQGRCQQGVAEFL
jgi:hypothetical protein